MKVVIIGGVAGGATTAARLRRLDEKVEIVIFEKGQYVSYANCGLPYYIGNIITERENLLIQTPEGFKERFDIDVRINSEVIQINTEDKKVKVHDLAKNQVYEESYDKLVISTGAEPIKPPFEGIENDRIFTLRNIPDMDKIKHFIETYTPKKAVVIGGGFIGLEMVENLHDLGLDVSVIERANQVMAPLDFPMAAIVHEHLKYKGVKLLLGESVQRFEEKEGQLNVWLEGDKYINADIVILSIGVKPDIKLAKEAGIALGELGGIKVNAYMQTSDPNIYALGDAVEVYNPVIGKSALIPLAGPANKQGRMVATNIIEGNCIKYTGTIGTAIAKVFDLAVSATGASSKLLDKEGIEHFSSYTHAYSHAGYYPGAQPMAIKINFSPQGKLLGAQVVGYDGVDKRIDLFAQVIKSGGTIFDLQEIEHAYAPPYSSAKDPVNMAGFVAENILNGKFETFYCHQLVEENPENIFLLDVRTKEEFEFGHIPNAVNIPLDEIRNRLQEVPKDKKVVLYCAMGLRGYLASRILKQNGFMDVYNLSGGYQTYFPFSKPSEEEEREKVTEKEERETGKDNVTYVDARGLQCPGPVKELKKNFDKIEKGDYIEIKVTDKTFCQDLKVWCEIMEAELISVKNEEGFYTALIKK